MKQIKSEGFCEDSLLLWFIFSIAFQLAIRMVLF